MLKRKFAFSRANTLRDSSVAPLVVIAGLALSCGVLGHHFKTTKLAEKALSSVPVQIAERAIRTTVQQVSQSSPLQAVAEAGANMASVIGLPAVNVTREAELDEDQTFAELLSDQGVADADALGAMNALAKVYDLRHLKAGQDVTLTFSRTDRQETFVGATFQPEDTKEIVLTRSAQGEFTGVVKPIPVTRQRFAARADIDSSLYEAGDSAGVPHAVMASLIRTYSHDIDFQRDIQPGDSFEVMYDQSVTAKGKPVGEGTIVYAAMHINGKTHPIYRVTFSDNSVDYFDETGHSIRRALLRTPVAVAHVTSGFGMRIHPLLGYSKMHKGVDFGAPIGTPIFAAGSGTIEDVGFHNGYGRYIRIRHTSSLETAYAHMSRFNAKLYRGAHVNQGDVIGYVGMSGRATGPHLHFETIVNGVQSNPLNIKMPTTRALEGKLLTAFKDGQGQIQHEFSALVSKKPVQSADDARTLPASTAAPAVTPAIDSKI